MITIMMLARRNREQSGLVNTTGNRVFHKIMSNKRIASQLGIDL